MTATDELKPCPFCGGKAHLFVESDNDNPFASNDECNYYWQVKHNCSMSDDANHYFIDSDFLCFRTPWFKDRQKVINVWNRRTKLGTECCQANETDTFSCMYYDMRGHRKRLTVHVMECTECGHVYEHINGDYEYCPRCGRKIVDE